MTKLAYSQMFEDIYGEGEFARFMFTEEENPRGSGCVRAPLLDKYAE